MIYSLVTEHNAFGVNREFRLIEIGDVNSDILIVHYDTERQTGVIEWKPTVVDYVTTRDLTAEEEAYKQAVANNQSLATLKPIMKSTPVRRPRKVISDFSEFEHLISRWEAAIPVIPDPPPPPPAEERVRLIEVVRLLRRKGILTAEDIEYLKSTVQET